MNDNAIELYPAIFHPDLNGAKRAARGGYHDIVVIPPAIHRSFPKVFPASVSLRI
jgi:hypothetical protein